jgi:hypothetical protein
MCQPCRLKICRAAAGQRYIEKLFLIKDIRHKNTLFNKVY